MRMVDLTGKRFCRLTVTGLANEKRNGQLVWRCECDCGNIVHCRGSALKAGYSKSCGCLHAECCAELGRRRRGPNLIGERFERLTVIRGEKSKSGGYVWVCQCECGNITKAATGALRSGNTKSCGCKGGDFLKSNNLNGVTEKTMLSSLATEKIWKNNKSGVRGVFKETRSGRWVAHIRFQGRRIYLGSFKELDDAAKARKEAEETYFRPMLEKYNWRGSTENADQ